MLLSDFLTEFYFPFRPSTSPRTKKLYDYSVRKFGQYLRKSPTLADLTDTIVGNYIAHLISMKMALTSVDKERRQLLAIWRDARDQGMVDKGPRIQRLVIPEQIPKALTIKEVNRLRAALPLLRGKTGGIPNCDFLGAFLAIQLETAARSGAVAQLLWSDITGDVITFRAETRKGKRKPIIKRVRPWVLDALRPIRTPKRERVFPIEKTNSTKIATLYARLFDRAGVEKPKGKSSHLMRSTHATWLDLNGGDATKSLGHANRATTQASYLDVRHSPGSECDLLPDFDLQ